MPRANPTASFDVAVRHLFRHLDDAAELRRNPLVRRYFNNQSGISTFHQKHVLSLIRSAIDAAADRYRDAAGPDASPSTYRQLHILRGSMQRVAVRDIANQLGISQRQCYRERSAIYRYIADCIRHGEVRQIPPGAHISSSIGIQMDRAAQRAANGDYHQAMRSYNSLIEKGDIRAKLEAFIKRVELELELGDLSSAETSLCEFSWLLKTFSKGLSDASVRRASVYLELFGSRLAWERGSFEEAARKLSIARSMSLAFRNDVAKDFRSLYADIALESADRAFNLGDFDATRAFVLVAKDADRTLLGPTARTACIVLGEALLSFVSMRPGGDATLHDQIALARQAQTIALQCGALKWRLHSEMFLTTLQRTSENILQRGELILSIARDLRNPPLHATLSLEFADLLLDTPFWRRAKDLMRVSVPKESFYAGNFSMLKALYYLKAGSAAGARRHAKVAYAIAKGAASPKLQASTLRILGGASYLLGHRGEAEDYILSTLPLAEKYGTALACLKAYQSAALITGRRKYAREARKLSLAVER